MGEMEGRLVVGHEDGKLHVLTEKNHEWIKRDQKNSPIKQVLCHKGVCLLCVKDTETHRVAINVNRMTTNRDFSLLYQTNCSCILYLLLFLKIHCMWWV